VWALEELGAPYTLNTMAGADRTGAEHRARHALGRVPVLEDDGAYLFESAAILLALADRHPEAGLNFALGTRERELVYQWVIFAMSELEPQIVEVRRRREEDPDHTATAVERVSAATALLETALTGHEFIVADRFSVADIALGAVLDFARRMELLADRPQIERYVDALMGRAAYERAYASP